MAVSESPRSGRSEDDMVRFILRDMCSWPNVIILDLGGRGCTPITVLQGPYLGRIQRTGAVQSPREQVLATYAEALYPSRLRNRSS